MSVKLNQNTLYLRNKNTGELQTVGMFGSGADKTLQEIKEYADETYEDFKEKAPQVTTLQTNLSEEIARATNKEIELDSNKQDVISDLETIRAGAAAGATALQEVPDIYRTASDQDVIDTGIKESVTELSEYLKKYIDDLVGSHTVVCDGISLSESNPSTIVVSKSGSFSAQKIPYDSTQPLRWISSNEDVLSIDSITGEATGISKGDAIVSARCGSCIESANVNVIAYTVVMEDLTVTEKWTTTFNNPLKNGGFIEIEVTGVKSATAEDTALLLLSFGSNITTWAGKTHVHLYKYTDGSIAVQYISTYVATAYIEANDSRITDDITLYIKSDGSLYIGDSIVSEFNDEGALETVKSELVALDTWDIGQNAGDNIVTGITYKKILSYY